MSTKGKVLASAFGLFIAGAVAGGFGSALVANGSPPSPFDGEPNQGAFAGEQRLKKMEERLTSKLDLNDEQSRKVHEILEGSQKRMRALMEEQRPKWKALREETRSSIEAVLTPEQREKFEALKSERKEHFRKRMRKGFGRREGAV